MDINQLKNSVFEKTGIKLDDSDPVFTVVALNDTVFENLLKIYEAALAKNNEVLDEKIGSLAALNKSVVEASHDLVEKANQAHLTAALKAAAEAKAEIMNAARAAVSLEVEKASAIVTNAAHQLAIASEKNTRNSVRSWAIVLTQAVIGGIVAGIVILVASHWR